MSRERMIIYSGCKECSFAYVSRLLERFMDARIIYGDFVPPIVDIRIEDLFVSLQRIETPSIYWVDTAFVRIEKQIKFKQTVSTWVTTSTWNKEILEKYGIKSRVVPRLFNDEIDVQPKTDKKYKYVILSTEINDDHKNMRLVYKLLKEEGLLEKTIKICFYDWCEIKPWSIDDRTKFELLSQAEALLWLSKSEGFGMPPIEAGFVGTPSIYLNYKYTSEPFKYTKGFPIEVEGVREYESPALRGYYFPEPIVDENEVKKEIRRDHKLTREEREEMRSRIKENLNHNKIIKELLEGDGNDILHL